MLLGSLSKKRGLFVSVLLALLLILQLLITILTAQEYLQFHAINRKAIKIEEAQNPIESLTIKYEDKASWIMLNNRQDVEYVN